MNEEQEMTFLQAELKVLIRIVAKGLNISDKELAKIWIEETRTKATNDSLRKQIVPELEKDMRRQAEKVQAEKTLRRKVQDAAKQNKTIEELEKDKQISQFAARISNGKRVAIKDPSRFIDDDFISVNEYPKQVIMLENEIGFNTKTNTRIIRLVELDDHPRTKAEKDAKKLRELQEEKSKQIKPKPRPRPREKPKTEDKS